MNALQKFSVAASTAVLALGVSAGSASSANLVVNGGFETGNFSGWTQSGNTGFTFVSNSSFSAPYEGNFAAFFGPVGSTGSITQVLSTIAGQSYELSYALDNLGGPINSFGASVGGNSVNSFTNSAPFPWTVFSSSFTASSASTALTFTFQQDPSFYGLDAVSVRAVPVPGAVFGVIVAGGALVARQRKNAKAKQTVA